MKRKMFLAMVLVFVFFFIQGCVSEKKAKELKDERYKDALKLLPSAEILEHRSWENKETFQAVVPLPENYEVSFKTGVPISITFGSGKDRYYLQMPNDDVYQVNCDDYGEPVSKVKLPNGEEVQVIFNEAYTTRQDNLKVQKVTGFGSSRGVSVYETTNPAFPGHGPGSYEDIDYRHAHRGYFFMQSVTLKASKRAKVLIVYKSH